MQQWEAVAQAIEFGEAHLKEPIRMADMAEAASYSLFHFCRVFNQITHITPYDYLMRRRLAEAARELLNGRRRIIDVAMDYQFNNPETFSRAFRRVFQTPPTLMRRGPAPDERLFLPQIRREHLRQWERNAAVPPAAEERPAARLSGWMTLVRGNSRVIPALWQSFFQQAERLFPGLAGLRFVGLAEFPPDWARNGWLYTAGVLDIADEAGWPTRRLEEGRFVRFRHCGGRETLPLTLDWIYQTWPERGGRRPVMEEYLEEFCSDPLAPQEIDVSCRSQGWVSA